MTEQIDLGDIVRFISDRNTLSYTLAVSLYHSNDLYTVRGLICTELYRFGSEISRFAHEGVVWKSTQLQATPERVVSCFCTRFRKRKTRLR